jgi:hypothetical protein
MSNNASGSQQTARQKLLELQQQLTDMEAAAQMEEEEDWKHKEEEWKHLEELRLIEEAEKRREAEAKRRREIVEKMVSFGYAGLLFFSNVRKIRALSAEQDGSCSRCKGQTCLWTDADRNPMVSCLDVSNEWL